MALRWLVGIASASIASAACSAPPSGTLQIVTPDGETDTWTRAPAATKLRVDAIGSSSDASSSADETLATAALPASSVDLGSVDPTTSGVLTVRGFDAAGDTVVFGETPPIAFGALDGQTLPVFVQRAGTLARLPGPLPDARPAPALTVLSGRWLLVAGGGDPSVAHASDLYDFLGPAPLTDTPTFQRAAASVVALGDTVWLVDASGASAYTFFSGQTAEQDVTAPPGGSFADVAGGATLTGSDGQYLVGATRTTGAPTAAVLFVDSTSGKPSWRSLAVPRLGAAAAWVDGLGVVVAGGSAAGAGVEVLAIGSTTGTPRPYLPDASTGSGAWALDAQHVVLAGGVLPDGSDAGVRVVDLVACSAQCSPSPWASLPVPLASAQVFTRSAGGAASDALVVGNEAGGATHVYDVAPASGAAAAVTEIPTAVPRRQARAIVSPMGSILVVGGAAPIESFVPAKIP